jgi:hypothetical protein
MYASDEPYRRPKGSVYFPVTEVKDGNPPDIIREGRDAVVSAVEKLSELGSTLFEHLDLL